MSALWCAALLMMGAGAARADLASAPELPPDVARGLLQRWLAAQNDGDFAAYQALYAAAFTGVRRSGERTVELDRAGWMRDRARMFKKKMRVAADAVTTSRAAGGTVLRFRQTWSSATYSDVGRKQLTLTVEGGEPRIAREEMLTSVKDDPEVAPLSDAEVAALRCLFKDVDARWRRVDGGVTVEKVETAPHAGATAVWATTSNGEALAICRGTRALARTDGYVGLGGPPGGIFAVTSRELRGDYLEVKPGVWALAVVSDLGTYEDVPGYVGSNDGQEGLEDGASGTLLELFAPVGGKLLAMYSAPLVASETCNFSSCTNRDCTLTTGKKGASGWFDLIEKCQLTDVEQGHEVKSYRKNTRYVFENDNYVQAIAPSKPSKPPR